MGLRVRSAFLCFILIGFAVLSASSQSRINVSGTGGVNIIKGRIYTSDGRAVDVQIKVAVQTGSGSDLTLITDQSGGFEFHNMGPGPYTVVVDAGDNFEVVKESVYIDEDMRPPTPPGAPPIPPRPKVYTVPVYLRQKVRAATTTQEKPGVVNAKYADVPEDALKHYQKGITLSSAKKMVDALAEFRQAIAIYPSLEPAFVEMGKIYLKQAKLDEAIRAFRTAVGFDPKDFDAKLNYGIALYNSRQADEAQKQLTEASALNAAAVWPHYYLGMIYIQKKDLDDAQTQLETAKGLKGDKNIPLLHRYLGGVYAAKNIKDKAADELEKYIQLSPDAKDADRIRQTIAELRNNKN